MKNFKVGKEVVCLTPDVRGSLKKNEIYVIKAVNISPCCGKTYLDVGVDFPQEVINVECYCKTLYPKQQFFGWAWWRFAPLDIDLTEIEEVLYDKV